MFVIFHKKCYFYWFCDFCREETFLRKRKCCFSTIKACHAMHASESYTDRHLALAEPKTGPEGFSLEKLSHSSPFPFHTLSSPNFPSPASNGVCAMATGSIKCPSTTTATFSHPVIFLRFFPERGPPLYRKDRNPVSHSKKQQLCEFGSGRPPTASI